MPCHVEALFSYSKEGQSCVKKTFLTKLLKIPLMFCTLSKHSMSYPQKPLSGIPEHTV